jgi:hypothetical protein
LFKQFYLTPFSKVKGRNFPVILSFLNNDKPAESSLEADYVTKLLSTAFWKDRRTLTGYSLSLQDILVARPIPIL